MKQGKKAAGIFLAAIMAVTGLTGCGGASPASEEAENSGEKADFKMAMISSEIGSEAFNLNA